MTGVAHATTGGATAALSTHRAVTHAMRYHLALPEGWAATREWPVLVAIPDAHRDFADNLQRFVRARGARPYILIAPEVLSCGGAGSRTADRYDYSSTVWDSLQGIDDFGFEDAGLAAVLADVHRQWHGDAKAFLTGWEAGGHTVWAQALRHPERWRGVAAVSCNYARRGAAPEAISRDPARLRLPLQPFRCGAPGAEAAAFIRFVDAQTASAIADARAHGFQPQPVRIVPNAAHGPLPEAVFAWCDSLRASR